MTTTTDRFVVDLDEEAALDLQWAGAKAAWLAHARRVGLPVLPGLVLLAPASAPAMSVGLETLSSSGSGAARMAVMAQGAPPALIEELTSRGTWWRKVVRSSSPLEKSGEWSGAFATFLDVGDGDLAKAISGCWASSFTVSTLERFHNSGLSPAAMAVLVQPFVDANAGGLARVKNGTVIIDWVPGSPAGLLAGRQQGRHYVVDLESGTPSGHSEPIMDHVASVARAAAAATGATQIEWLEEDGKVWIVQLGAPAQAEAPAPALDLPADPELRRVARVLRRFPGRWAEQLVLPWALSLADPAATDDVEPIEGGDPASIHHMATETTNQVWQSPLGAERAAATLAQLAGDPLSVLPLLSRLRPVEIDHARLLVGLMRGLEEREGLVPSRYRRFEPLGAAVTEAFGQRQRGIAASPGVGFGRGIWVQDPGEAQASPRPVIVARQPIPHLAPLLWTAAGLVTLSGSPAAHLFASARSLGVPAVAG
ncbi:MAG TPA: PEP/pyruvate-binding domain-containing protein, partial [Acidimicrobiia bacterium]|nr:PEP/pyruvate-binding domain-containing protein [Acidimicrobiia bacterium]